MKRKKHAVEKSENDTPKPLHREVKQKTEELAKRAPTVGTKLKGLIEVALKADAEKKAAEKAQPKPAAKPSPKSASSKPQTFAQSQKASAPKASAPKASAPKAPVPAKTAAPAEPAKAPVAPNRPPSNTLRGDDRIAYFDAIAGVRPLGAVKGKLRHEPSLESLQKNPVNQALVANERQTNDASARKKLGELLGGGYEFDMAVDEDDVLEALRRDAPIEALNALRMPNPRVDGTLDLHGLREAEVEDRLARWVREQHRKGARRLLIIHGKGLRSPHGVAVLRDCVRLTLSSSIATPLVHAFASAPPSLGGTGATLVELGRS